MAVQKNRDRAVEQCQRQQNRNWRERPEHDYQRDGERGSREEAEHRNTESQQDRSQEAFAFLLHFHHQQFQPILDGNQELPCEVFRRSGAWFEAVGGG